ncbi:hypothetical protein ACVWWG_001345 [Bradyrhizobium sp. LB7.2]
MLASCCFKASLGRPSCASAPDAVPITEDCVSAPAAMPDAVPGSSLKMKANASTMTSPVPPSTSAMATCASVRMLSEAKNSGPDR